MKYHRTIVPCAVGLITFAVSVLSLGCGGKKEPAPVGTVAASPATPNSQLPPEPAPPDSADLVNASDSKPTKSSALSVTAATTDAAHQLELIATMQDEVVDGTIREVVVGSKCLAFGPDGVLATASPLAIWKVGTGKPIWKPEGFVEVERMAFSPDGSLLALGDDDGTVSLWDVKAKEEKHEIQQGEQGVKSLVFAPNGKFLVTSDFQGQIKLWDVESGKNLRSIPISGVRHVAISPDSKTLVSAGKSVQLWDVATGEAKGELTEKAGEPRVADAWEAAFAPNGQLVATADFSQTEFKYGVLLWDIAARKLKAILSPNGPDESVQHIAFSANGKFVASHGMRGRKIWIWRIADHKLVQTLKPEGQGVNAVAWSRDGKYLAAVGDDKSGSSTIWIWQLGPVETKTDEQPTTNPRAATPARNSTTSPLTSESAADAPTKPATLEQLVQAADLSKLARLEGAIGLNLKPHRSSYSAPSTLDVAAQWHRKELTGLGWTEAKRTISGLDASKHVVAFFEKGEFGLVLSISAGDMPGVVKVNLGHQGNVDPRQLPRPANVQIASELRTSVTYTSAAGPDDAAAFCSKEFLALGWTDDPDPLAEFHKKEGRTILRFAANAMSLTAVIVPENGKTTVTYYPSVSEDAVEQLQLRATQTQKSPKPATLEQSIGVIDLRKFPRPEEATILSSHSDNLTFVVAGDFEETVRRHHDMLIEQGWKEFHSSNHRLEGNSMLHFAKDGFFACLQVSQSKPDGPVSVSLNNCGNVDVRQFPLLPESKIWANAEHSNINYTTTATREKAAEFYRAELTERGWTELTGSGGSSSNERGTVQKFAQNAMRLWIEIGTGSDEKMHVSIRSSIDGAPDLTPKSDSKAKEAATKPAAGQPAEVASLLEDLPIPEEANQLLKPTVPITQLAQAGADESQAKEKSAPTQPAIASDKPLVQDIPIPDGATDITYIKRRGDVRFQVASEFKTTGNFYAKKLSELRWTKSGKDNLQRNFWVQKFAKGNLSLEVRVDSREGGSEVRLTPTGLLWDEDLALHAKDLAIPEDATDIEYQDFLGWIRFKSPSDVKSVADFLTQNLEKQKWTKSGTDQVTERFVRLERANGKSSLSLDVTAESDGCRVWISTKGLNWDGIKEAQEEAKKTAKSAKKVAAKTPSQTKPDDEPAALPKRKDKPKQGIDKLPKLPNEGTVTVDGKTFKLTSVVAYEVFSRDEWLTRIVATQKPIKQETLLAALKEIGTKPDRQEDIESVLQNVPQPFLQVELDENDRLQRLSLRAGDTPGNGSGDELSGSALVEDGRARGTVKLKEPGEFFDKVYTAEISFDVPVLMRDSTPAKRLTNAPKLANSGTLTIGGKSYKLSNVVAYEMKRFDDKPVTAIVLSEKPLNMTKLKAAAGTKGIDDYFEFTPQVKLVVDADDNVSDMNLWADNVTVGGNEHLAAEVVIEGGRARGTAKLTKPGEFLDKKYTFDLSFDVDVLGKPPSASRTTERPAGGLIADSAHGLPIPEGHNDLQQGGSRFRKEIKASIAAELKAVIDFYRRELSAAEWKEIVTAAKVEPQSAQLAFTGPTGSLTVKLKTQGRDTVITLVTRDTQAAKAAGLLPSAGKGRLILGNSHEKAATITVNKKDYNLAAGVGADDPKTGLNWEVAPGKYTVEIKLPGEKAQTENLTIGVDEVWGVVILPTGGYLTFQLY